jgi:hypothetical protein
MKWWVMLKCWLLNRINEVIRENSTHKAIPGVYEREYRYGSTLIKDVLTITCLSMLSDVYQVERRTTHTDPEELPWEQKIRHEKWIAAYHTPTRQLVRGVSGRICAFVPEQATVLFEDKEYRKMERVPFDLETL